MPASSAWWTTAFDWSKSQRMPKLLQPRPTTETWRPERPRWRYSTRELLGLSLQVSIAMKRDVDGGGATLPPMERRPSRTPRLLLATAGTLLVACSGGAQPSPTPSVPATMPAQAEQPTTSSTSEPEQPPEVLTGVAPPVRFLTTTVWDPVAGKALLYA